MKKIPEELIEDLALETTNIILNKLGLYFDKDYLPYYDYIPDFLAEEYKIKLEEYVQYIIETMRSEEKRNELMTKYIIKWDLI